MSGMEWITGASLGMFCLIAFMAIASFAGTIALIIFLLRRAQAEQARIDRLPVETAFARVVGKRSETTGMSNGPVSTHYYATFDLDDGRRLELRIGEGYGLLVEGDEEKLTYQGPRFKEFQRVGPT